MFFSFFAAFVTIVWGINGYWLADWVLDRNLDSTPRTIITVGFALLVGISLGMSIATLRIVEAIKSRN